MYEVIFWYVKVCIFWECIQYIIHWDKTQTLKKMGSFGPFNLSGKVKGPKDSIFFLPWAPTHHSFTFNLRLLHELEHKVRLSKTVSGIFHFVFIKVYIFVQQNAWALWYFLDIIIPFKTEMIEKPHTISLLELGLSSCNKKFQNSMITAWVGASKKLTWRLIF